MDRDTLREALVRYGLLFLISMILVAGFWFHAEFYALGLVPLLLVGGFVTFLVILSVRALATGSLRARKPGGSLTFTREAGERVLTGTQTISIVPLKSVVPPAGAIANAVVAATGQIIARVHIRDLRRVLAADVRDADAAAAGFDDFESFRRAWTAGRRWDPKEIVLLVDIRKEARG